MDRVDFRKLFAYSDNCWREMGEVVEAAGDAWNVPFETVSSWNTVRLLLAHTIAAEERMVSWRLLNQEIETHYEKRAAGNWAGLYSDQREIRLATYNYLDSLTDDQICGDEVAIPSIDGRPALTRADALFHVLNHENYHRGEVVMSLQRLGIDPPNFDYVLLKAPN